VLYVNAQGRSALDMSTPEELWELKFSVRAKSRLLAFVMGFHKRLGAQSWVGQLLDKEMVEIIAKTTSEYRDDMLRLWDDLKPAIECVNPLSAPSCPTQNAKVLACCECATIMVRRQILHPFSVDCVSEPGTTGAQEHCSVWKLRGFDNPRSQGCAFRQVLGV
jgi:hypothetical protein